MAHAGAILLSRTAECPEKRLDETVAMLRGLNEHARKPVPPRYEGYVHAAGLMLSFSFIVKCYSPFFSSALSCSGA